MRLSRGIISMFLGAAATAVTARTSSDLPLSMAHRLVIRSMDRRSSSSPTQSARRDLSHADEAITSATCTICFDGNEPYRPHRHLMVNPPYETTSSTAGKTSGQEDTDDDGTNNSTPLQHEQQQQPPLTCSEYNNAFLSKLFPQESSCRAFQGSAADICGCARPPSLCTLCEFGVPPARPNEAIPAGLVGNTGPVTCAEWDRSPSTQTRPSFVLEDDPECDVIRSVGEIYCGCPEPCRFCGEGYRIGNPTQAVLDTQNMIGNVVGPFDDDEDPTCRDVSNAAATASALISISSMSPVDSTDVMDGSDICEVYKHTFASTCSCIKAPNPNQRRHNCHLCEGGFEDPTKSIHVTVDGIALSSTCANADSLSSLGLNVCSEITDLDCPCAEDEPVFNHIVDLEPVDEQTGTTHSASGDEGPFDAVGVSLAVSTMIVIVASIL